MQKGPTSKLATAIHNYSMRKAESSNYAPHELLGRFCRYFSYGFNLYPLGECVDSHEGTCNHLGPLGTVPGYPSPRRRKAKKEELFAELGLVEWFAFRKIGNSYTF